jgi:large subunit ribosomal protein L19e
MTKLNNQRRLAAQILKCGENRIWMDPTSTEELEDAVTRSDIKHAISLGAIRKHPEQGVSRGRAKVRAEERRRGHHKGEGSRRGSPNARSPGKDRWMQRVRPQRALLVELRTNKRIEPKNYREFYRKVKGGMFRSRAHLMANLKLANVVKEA